MLVLSRREVEELLDVDALIEELAGAMVDLSSGRGSNDLLQPIEQGLITADHVHAEIGELVDGTKPGRQSSEQITLYKSVGVAVQDGAAAALVLRAARRRGAGHELEL